MSKIDISKLENDQLGFSGHLQKIIALISLFTLLGIYPVIAQSDFRKGFYITQENDSITVPIAYRIGKSAFKVCIYRSPSSNKKEKLYHYPPQIKAYGFIKGPRYASMKLPMSQGGRQVFMEHLVDGTMDLFRWEDGYYVQVDSLIFLPPKKSKTISTDKGQMMRTDRPYVGILNILMQGCALSADKIEYDEKELIALIQNYNRCMGGKRITYKNKLPSIRITPQLFAAVDISNFAIEGIPKNTFQKSVSPIYGASLEFSWPRVFDRISFSIEGLYTKKSYQGYAESILATTTRTDYFVDFTLLKIPVGLRYSFFEDGKTPYIKAGFVQYFELNASSMTVLKESESNGIVSTEYEELELNGRYKGGFWLSAGYTKIFYKKLKGFIEVRYEKVNGSIGTGFTSSSSSTNCLNIIAGIRL